MNDETQDFPKRDPKSAFFGIHFQIVLATTSKDLDESIPMIPMILLNFFTHHVMEDGSHSYLICSFGVLEAKWHNSVVEIAKKSSEGRLPNVSRRHFHLVVATKTVHEGEHFITGGRVDEDIHVWKRKFILWVRFVKVTKVHTYLDLTILFLYKYDVGEPCGMLDGFDKASFNKLFNLMLNLSFQVELESLGSLLD